MIKFTIITLFPESVKGYLEVSMMWKARELGLFEFELVDLREFGLGPHRSVDDTPYGGGDGMLMRVEPVAAALEQVRSSSLVDAVIVPTPSGVVWNQEWARRLAGVGLNDVLNDACACKERVGRDMVAGGAEAGEGGEAGSGVAMDVASGTTSGGVGGDRHYVIFCPRYEGFDERIMELVDLPVCVGEYVLTGGEIPALVIIDSVVRLIPGVLGGETSAEVESFSEGGNLEFPQWTKPAEWQGLTVPEVLLSGNHGKIAEWRAEEAKKRGKLREEFAKKFEKMWEKRKKY